MKQEDGLRDVPKDAWIVSDSGVVIPQEKANILTEEIIVIVIQIPCLSFAHSTWHDLGNIWENNIDLLRNILGRK